MADANQPVNDVDTEFVHGFDLLIDVHNEEGTRIDDAVKHQQPMKDV